MNTEYNEMTSDSQVGKYLYIWIDILGFGDFVKKGDYNTYEKMINLVNSFRNKFSKIEITPKILIPISDGIVVVFELNKIELIFETIAKTQLEFILQEQEFLRGGKLFRSNKRQIKKYYKKLGIRNYYS